MYNLVSESPNAQPLTTIATATREYDTMMHLFTIIQANMDTMRLQMEAANNNHHSNNGGKFGRGHHQGQKRNVNGYHHVRGYEADYDQVRRVDRYCNIHSMKYDNPGPKRIIADTSAKMRGNNTENGK